jgi:hypothetical protein
MAEVIAALMGALVGGMAAYWVAMRQTRIVLEAEAAARAEDRREADAERRRASARVVLGAVSAILINAENLPNAWGELGEVSIVGDETTRSFTPRAWTEQRRAAEHAIEAIRAAATTTATDLVGVGLYERVWYLAGLADDNRALETADAMTDFIAYARYVYDSLGTFIRGGEPIPAHVDPPSLDGTWQPPSASTR